ncbi:hypothetical protein BEWA_020640 [Theileria equi strain WA]|uniref:Pru domain-containing protein n=1 Tax=Theileria equi strain WA TaxID=1537102 RepID=L0AU99_THEEQ|nr:hypothetical protein BEWA_020640 [Theileria equi strain WA]AFZ79217.1 hypothetical protein BEWA_020640 [Theileria equi strain WA]|eukprot:XP_004828883.1 hypothetical protein BEWA_020640 [Theileria equi strain WA]
MVPEKGVICEIRAGKCNYKDNVVSPDERKGCLRLYRGDDCLLSSQWLTREDNKIEDNHYVFDDAYLERIDRCDTGEVYVLRFTNSPLKLLYWMQETNLTTIKNFVETFNLNTGSNDKKVAVKPETSAQE